jgi:hypothetical protein
MRRSLAAAVVVSAALGGCSGRVASQGPDARVEDVAFLPAVGTAGYGLSSGYRIELTDATTDGVTRTLTIQLADIKNGSYTVDGARSSGRLVQGAASSGKTFRAIGGTVTLVGSPTKVQPPGTTLGSLGSVSGHFALTLVNEADPGSEMKIQGDYLAGVTYVG